MAKTRRQRALEHPDMPKKGVRDKRRIAKPEESEAARLMGRIGGNADHASRGLETASELTKFEVSMAGVKARRERGLLPTPEEMAATREARKLRRRERRKELNAKRKRDQREVA